MSDSAYSPTWYNLKCNVETGNIVSYNPDVDFVRLTEFLCSELASADPGLDSKLESVRTTSTRKKKPEWKGKTARKAELTSKRLKLDEEVNAAESQCAQVPLK